MNNVEYIESLSELFDLETLKKKIEFVTDYPENLISELEKEFEKFIKSCDVRVSINYGDYGEENTIRIISNNKNIEDYYWYTGDPYDITCFSLEWDEEELYLLFGEKINILKGFVELDKILNKLKQSVNNSVENNWSIYSECYLKFIKEKDNEKS